ncbi:MAG: NUDIX hydrolase [Pseudomonadota bacterium]
MKDPLNNKKMVRPVMAATCLVVRDGPTGLEVLMVERNRNIVFGGGMLVFPGGKLDRGDLSKTPAKALRGGKGAPHMVNALALTAAREVFEETGLLLTRSSQTKRQPPERVRRKLARRWRDRLGTDRKDMDAFFYETGQYLDLKDFGYFARWITPYGQVKRYDTYFYLARAPKHQVMSHDGWELVNARWITPSEALAREGEGGFQMMFPTRMNLRRLSKYASVRDAFSMTWAESVIPVLPKVEKLEGRVMARIPTNAGYGKEGLYQRLKT